MNEGNGQLFWREEGIHIPSAYQKIEGCKTGTYNSGPWFSTGVRIVGQNLKLEGYALLRDSSGEWNCILGAETSDNSSDTIKVRRQENDRICCNHNDNAYIEAGFNTWFYFYVDATTLKVNNETRTLTWASQVKSPDIIIGGQHTYSTGDTFSNALQIKTSYNVVDGQNLGLCIGVNRGDSLPFAGTVDLNKTFMLYGDALLWEGVVGVYRNVMSRQI